MAVEFLSDDQAEYGAFPASLSRSELERYFFLDDADRGLLRGKRRTHNRLGFAIQLASVGFLGRFMPDPRQVPSEVAEYLAEQLEIADPSCLKDYGERDGTARTHAGEIQKTEGWRNFSEVTSELSEWLDARAWTTGAGPKPLFDAAVGWLRERKVLLPGATRLTRLVGSCREAATQRLWETPHDLLDDDQRAALDGLLEVPEGHRHSRLDRMRRPPTRVSGPAMVDALQCAAEILGLGFAEVDTAVVPPRRLAELSRYGVQGKANLLRRHGDSRRLAMVAYLQTRAVDDALDLLDVLISSKLLARAERESAKEKLRTVPKLRKASAKLAAALGVLGVHLRPAAGRPAGSEAVAHRPQRRLRHLRHGRPRPHRPGPGTTELGRHPARHRLHPHRRGPGARCDGADAARLSPFVRHHINMLGRYSFLAPELAGGLRPLRDPATPDEVEID
ncbi:DUF4158 domain-containing protein [Saccharopolyspora sp. K220]|nr:DUF4158 domain-containing protein [Saccharopolyspora soli]MCI2423734.1 DUF4158 domain-containing protein [Saccharopolyspora soli]